jgi:catechol 2,3-dioxygenase-like lactoylglutathione lyase family enzyme
MGWALGQVGHFGLAVRNPRRSADWWIRNLGMHEAFAYDDSVAVENDAVTIVFHRGAPAPQTIGHMSFHLRSLAELRVALGELRARGVDLEDPGDEIGPEAPGSKNIGLWFHDPDGYRWELSVQAAGPD